MGSTRSHWDDVYKHKSSTDVSWYQPHLDRSLSWICTFATPSASVIDIGGGASTLVDDLLVRGFRDVTVLDVSNAAMEVARQRLREQAAQVDWIVADIADWQPPKRYRVWHDRAVFHFMTSVAQQDAYLSALLAGTEPGSLVVMGTFALDGPEKCSGLPVHRYSRETLSRRLGTRFQVIDQAQEVHKTPGAVEQNFSFVALRRVN